MTVYVSLHTIFCILIACLSLNPRFFLNPKLKAKISLNCSYVNGGHGKCSILGGSGKEIPLPPKMLHMHFALNNVLPC